jgi:hypothetical protein
LARVERNIHRIGGVKEREEVGFGGGGVLGGEKSGEPLRVVEENITVKCWIRRG